MSHNRFFLLFFCSRGGNFKTITEPDFIKESKIKMVLNEVLDMEECLEEVFEDMEPDLFPGIQNGRATRQADMSNGP